MTLAAALLVSTALLHPIPRFPMRSGPLAITRGTHAGTPFTVAGEHGAILGEQDGRFEAWAFPVKILSHFRITAELADYPVPIDVNAHAATIEVTPGWTTITYSHAAFTVKQHMFCGAVDPCQVLFEIASVRPMRLTFRFQPDVLRMWPAPNFGHPSAEWMPQGYYVLHTDDPELSAAVGMPRAEPGILPPYQERPQRYPLELRLSFNPKKDSDLFFPLLMAVGSGRPLAELNGRIQQLYEQTQDYYDHFFDHRLTVETPDAQFDRAMRWAEIAIDQARVKFHDETGLVAGYYESGDSARPGFAWFFGRDTLWTSYAVNSYGDFALTRHALEFLIRRQRADGKIMHEFSQTADLVDWKALPYFYAAADSTPLFVMAMEDYVNTSGDLEFLRKHWDAVQRAYAFTRAHDSSDGVYTNTEGTGWVESWPPGMPHQECYLAALDQQSAGSMARLAALMKDDALAASAHHTSDQIRGILETKFYDPDSRFYAFSRNPDGTLDKAATIFPSVAWWDGKLSLANAGPMLSRWASPEFSTDWGLRDLSPHAPFYDPISYHQGSVWPLFTGWAALAEYRAGRTLAGYAQLMQNVDLTWAQDVGAVTELLSGEFLQPLGRSAAHQLWSSAMVLTPALRGLLGLDWDALHGTLQVTPHLPANWDHATLRNVPLGDLRLNLTYRREEGRIVINGLPGGPQVFPLPPVELALPHGLPLPGSQTAQLKAIDEQLSANQFTVTLAAPGGATHELSVRLNRSGIRITGAELAGQRVRVQFPPGAGYQRKTIAFSW